MPAPSLTAKVCCDKGKTKGKGTVIMAKAAAVSLSDIEAGAAADSAADLLGDVGDAAGDESGSPETILIHFVEDGFTALEATWYKGQELEVEVGSDAYKATLDRNGANSWLHLTENDQIRRYKKVMFRVGPWQGLDYEDETAQAAEDARGRKTVVANPGRII